MDALFRELFTTDVGILSLLALAGVVGVGVYMWYWVRRRIDEDSRRQ